MKLERDLRREICRAALDQEALIEAPAVFVLAAVYERTAAKYGRARAERYVHLEAGHAAQNLLLQAVSLGLGAVPIGAFDDDTLHRALGLPRDHRPVFPSATRDRKRRRVSSRLWVRELSLSVRERRIR